MEELNELIESCSSNPIKCMKHITKLAQYVQIIINNKTLWEKIFLSKDAQTQLELVIDKVFKILLIIFFHLE